MTISSKAAAIAATLAALAHSASAAPPPVPPLSAFDGTWKIGRVIGAGQGGVTAADPKALLGKTVRWGPAGIVSPDGDCHLRAPTVSLMDNTLLQTSVWGGQLIAELDLPKTDIGKYFGPQQTAIFQDASGCANGVLLGENHLVEAFANGYIYRLDRVAHQ